MKTKENKPVVVLTNADGNVFNLMGLCSMAMKSNNYPKEKIREFQNEVMESSSYDKALQVMMKWCDVQ